MEARVVEMTRVELLGVFDEIVAILESERSPAEKLEQIEAVMFEPKDVEDEDADLETDED
jgi:hypothetical protein